MSVNLSILYPNNDDTTFNLDYYLNTHIPKVIASLTNHGLVSWQVIKFGPGQDGAKPDYQVGCLLTWKDQDSLKAASEGPMAQEVFADLPNYCNQKPTVLAGGVLAGSG